MTRRALAVPTALLALTLIPAAAHADTFTVPPGNIQLIEFVSEAPIEDIRGISTDASGTIDVDPANPGTVSGTVEVPVKTLKTGNTTRDGHLQQKEWLDADNHPMIRFEITSASFKESKPLGDGVKLEGTAKGKLTIKGKTKAIEVPIKIAYLKASDTLKKVYIKGNALRIKTTFDVTLADFGVVPPDHIVGIKVAETVTVTAALTAVDQ